MPRCRLPSPRLTWLIWAAMLALGSVNLFLFSSTPHHAHPDPDHHPGPEVRALQLQPGRDSPLTIPLSIPLVSDMNSTTHEYGWRETLTIQPQCKHKYSAVTDLPDVSVIISFHEVENVTNILRTVQSIVQRTPPALLREVILVDDNTFKEDLRGLLPVVVQSLWGSRVRLLQSDRPLGLIQARLMGIRAAQGAVVMVMDGHMEVQNLWVEPLLHEIHENPGTMASPFMDWIERKGRKWLYRHGASSWTTHFDWSMVFGFFSTPDVPLNAQHDPTQPIRSSVSVGTFAIRKDFFWQVGGFDEGMMMWGGENIDLAIRVWLFGGRVVNVPCSHIAHVEAVNSRNYRHSWTSYTQHNYKRIAEVWLDEHKHYFYNYYPALKDMDVGDLSSRHALREKASHNFTWFLQNVFPELGVPDRGQGWGGVVNELSGWCMRTLPHADVVISPCNEEDIHQDVYLSEEKHLRRPLYILQIQRATQLYCDDFPKLYGSKLGSEWQHNKDSLLRSERQGLCVEAQEPQPLHSTAPVQLKECDPDNIKQRWSFRQYHPAFQDSINPSHITPNPAPPHNPGGSGLRGPPNMQQKLNKLTQNLNKLKQWEQMVGHNLEEQGAGSHLHNKVESVTKLSHRMLLRRSGGTV